MELTPEAQAVIDAVLIEHDRIGMTSARIVAAVDAYQASIKPPEPFTRYMIELEGRQFAYSAWSTASNSLAEWEVLITPVRKVSG